MLIIRIAKNPPNSSPIKAKIKSECTSGRFLATVPYPIPCPKNPPFSKDSKDLDI